MSAIEASSVGVKTMADGTLRITLDIEPRFAKDAFGLFGSPGTPVALAALKTAAQQEAAKPKGGELAKLAGQWCQNAQFIEFIRPIYDKAMGGTGRNWGDVTPDDFDGGASEYARHCICVLCGVNSRAELDHDRMAATRFHTLIRQPFADYLKQTAAQPA